MTIDTQFDLNMFKQTIDNSLADVERTKEILES